MIIMPSMQELAKIHNAKTFEQCLDVALAVLQRADPPIEMVCGPISTGGYGSVEKNLAVFKEYIKEVSKRGVRVWTQMVFENAFHRILRTPYHKGGLHLLEAFYEPIFKAGMLSVFHFIPRWETSEGAKWEHEQAKKLGIRVEYLH